MNKRFVEERVEEEEGENEKDDRLLADQDMVNRRISMDMMLKVAGSQRYRQFIFLTPQSMR